MDKLSFMMTQMFHQIFRIKFSSIIQPGCCWCTPDIRTPSILPGNQPHSIWSPKSTDLNFGFLFVDTVTSPPIYFLQIRRLVIHISAHQRLESLLGRLIFRDSDSCALVDSSRHLWCRTPVLSIYRHPPTASAGQPSNQAANSAFCPRIQPLSDWILWEHLLPAGAVYKGQKVLVVLFHLLVACSAQSWSLQEAGRACPLLASLSVCSTSRLFIPRRLSTGLQNSLS